MQEALLHFVWQFQYFSRRRLTTTDGESLQVLKPGLHNVNAGPDFLNAKVKIGNLEWAGMVEMHVNASDWYLHSHHEDQSYENVVLHVVWNANRRVMRPDGSVIPTVELKDRVAPDVLTRYKELMNNVQDIPCSNRFREVSPLVVHSMLDRTVLQRLERRAVETLKMVEANHGDWEEATYQLVTRYFGFKVNNEAFQQLAQSVSYKTLLKHRDQPHQVEALLFGQAGFLDAVGKGDYPTLLKREYKLLSSKYDQANSKMNVSQWRFLRLRPANFPTVRLAQLCALLCKQHGLFSKIISCENPKEIKSIFEVTQSEYWLTHYHFGTRSKIKVAGIGTASIDLLCINVVAPLLAANGKAKGDQSLIDRAVDLLQSTAGESNRIVKRWNEVGYNSKNAFDSQALLELYKEYCQRRRCLTCAIGTALLKPVD